jgi:hypothetical protein
MCICFFDLLMVRLQGGVIADCISTVMVHRLPNHSFLLGCAKKLMGMAHIVQLVTKHYHLYVVTCKQTCKYFSSCTSHKIYIVLREAAERSRSHLSHPWHELLSPFPR